MTSHFINFLYPLIKPCFFIFSDHLSAREFVASLKFLHFPENTPRFWIKGKCFWRLSNLFDEVSFLPACLSTLGRVRAEKQIPLCLIAKPHRCNHWCHCLTIRVDGNTLSGRDILGKVEWGHHGPQPPTALKTVFHLRLDHLGSFRATP